LLDIVRIVWLLGSRTANRELIPRGRLGPPETREGSIAGAKRRNIDCNPRAASVFLQQMTAFLRAFKGLKRRLASVWSSSRRGGAPGTWSEGFDRQKSRVDRGAEVDVCQHDGRRPNPRRAAGLPMTETDLKSDHAGGDGRFQLPYTRLSPLNSTQPAVISTQPAVISTQPASFLLSLRPNPPRTGANWRLLLQRKNSLWRRNREGSGFRLGTAHGVKRQACIRALMCLRLRLRSGRVLAPFEWK
jgi:hypothetical protein